MQEQRQAPDSQTSAVPSGATRRKTGVTASSNPAKSQAGISKQSGTKAASQIAGATPPPKTYRQVQRLINDSDILDLWLEGIRISEIASMLDLSIPQVTGSISRSRNRLYADHEGNLEDRTETSVAKLERIQRKLWDLWYDESTPIRLRVQALQEVRKCEETIAKIRGVLTSKGQLDVNVRQQKLYDFEDHYPDMPEATIIDAEPNTSDGAGGARLLPETDSARVLDAGALRDINRANPAPDDNHESSLVEFNPVRDDERLFIIAMPGGKAISVPAYLRDPEVLPPHLEDLEE